ncbi:universal stress protein [Actinorugispora endophytica]|uniref:Nucleotide-binding universal stress UspA family protein n=1 Tax=Actinorugispora endophytica TaxID=1605990 RepID=A0A4R6UXX7_9ACTN|nr:universal stress protein [Actinorugispora endophytica]TDQ52291.1 nucleotide-binding universal stress UspA family protein [Actinorugispora endophytica]
MAGNENAPIVAAVDETEGSGRALDWAVDQARLLRRRLRLVYAFDWPLYHSAPRGLPGFDLDEIARRVVRRAEERARGRAPELDVETAHVTGPVAPTLLVEARSAHTVVVGSRGLEGLRAVVVGSTGMQLTALAACPVVVVPDREPRPAVGRVVVGVDGSATARAAAGWAFAEASARGALLRAVTVHDRVSHGIFGPLEELPAGYSGDPDEGAAWEEARRRLSESIAGLRELHPDVSLQEEVSTGHPAEVLTAESERADLLVVGSRGHGGFVGLLLGSVSQGVLSHSHCPVAVVHEEDRR